MKLGLRVWVGLMEAAEDLVDLLLGKPRPGITMRPPSLRIAAGADRHRRLRLLRVHAFLPCGVRLVGGWVSGGSRYGSIYHDFLIRCFAIAFGLSHRFVDYIAAC